MDDIRFSSPLCSFVSFVVKVLAFPITAMSAMTRDSGAHKPRGAKSPRLNLSS
jgi:hypothetical protein